MKQLRKRLTYANVMSTIAVFLVIGGASAFAAVQLGKNTVGSKQLKKNAVSAPKIKNEAVTTAKIKAGAVSETKLSNGAVTSSKLGENSVINGKIGESAVTTGKLAGEAVTTGKIANDAVTGAKVNEDSLTGVVKNVTFEGDVTGGGSEDERTLEIDCGPGRRVIGGFYDAFDFGPDVKITIRGMRRTTIGGEAGRGLQVFAEEITPTANTWQISASAACATL